MIAKKGSARARAHSAVRGERLQTTVQHIFRAFVYGLCWLRAVFFFVVILVVVEASAVHTYFHIHYTNGKGDARRYRSGVADPHWPGC